MQTERKCSKKNPFVNKSPDKIGLATERYGESCHWISIIPFPTSLSRDFQPSLSALD